MLNRPLGRAPRIAFAFAYTTIAATLVALPDTCPAVSFMPIDFMPGFERNARANGISGDGRVVVGEISTEAFVWTASTGMVRLWDYSQGAATSRATAASYDGSVITGTFATGAGYQAFRWTAQTGIVGLGNLPNASSGSYAFGISADGTRIAGQANSQPALWTAETGFVSLGDLPGGGWQGSASGISADGSTVVGTSTSATGVEAFRWTLETGMTGLGNLPNSRAGSFARATSADGSVVVGSANTSSYRQEAFRWTTESGMVSLGQLPTGEETGNAYAVSADGRVVVGGSGRAFVWDDLHGTRDLAALLSGSGIDLSGWQLYSATGVSADGRTVTGWGINPDGMEQSWVASITEVPAPSAAILLISGLIGLTAGFRKKRDDE